MAGVAQVQVPYTVSMPLGSCSHHLSLLPPPWIRPRHPPPPSSSKSNVCEVRSVDTGILVSQLTMCQVRSTVIKPGNQRPVPQVAQSRHTRATTFTLIRPTSPMSRLSSLPRRPLLRQDPLRDHRRLHQMRNAMLSSMVLRSNLLAVHSSAKTVSLHTLSHVLCSALGRCSELQAVGSPCYACLATS